MENRNKGKKEGTKQTNQESIRIFGGNENYNYLENIESGHHQTNRDERKK